jgi:hypothetical protein
MSQWYYVSNGNDTGPVDKDDLVAKLTSGELSQDTLVWTEGMAEWEPATQVLSVGPDTCKVPPPSSQVAGSEPNERHSIKKTPVILTIIFTVITGGIYYPCWFLTRRASLNSLTTKEKLGKGVFIFAIVIFSISLLLSFVIGFFEGIGEELGDIDFLLTSKMLDTIDRIISLVAGITLLFQCFKVKRMLQDHFNQHLGLNLPFSGVATFFFQIYYLQYKINRV